MYRLNAPPARATSATNLVLANDLVFSVGQVPGVADAATLLPLADALFTVLLLLELQAAVKASSPITRIMDNFRTIRFPPLASYPVKADYTGQHSRYMSRNVPRRPLRKQRQARRGNHRPVGQSSASRLAGRVRERLPG